MHHLAKKKKKNTHAQSSAEVHAHNIQSFLLEAPLHATHMSGCK